MKGFGNRASGGDAIVVLIVVTGFFWLMSQDKFYVQDLLIYLVFLVVIAVFYFASHRIS